MQDFQKKQPCNDCPYRKDAPLRKWHYAEFLNLLKESDKTFGAIFGCHKKDGHTCVGWLIKQDEQRFPNLNLRIKLLKHNVGREYLDNLANGIELYGTVKEMIKANYPEISK